ncbi:hypothetical protein Ddye_031997 [Dipteronia dyeriana]|uniref:Leucine-rich repeat-containing N-terminal plant-type domain-containing protein n=1 Tax=Dipteronia dyeriana TaxID=168575 RepID=A0AAD9TJD3_9ROSI|nr:hypothetical protein Ddye_031997 [Dipteronia dyeriana]
MPSSILLYCLCFLLIYIFSTPSTAKIHSNETDCLALLAIKSRLRDPLGVTSSWNNSVPLCLWTSFSCGLRHERVTDLDLRNQSIGGTIPNNLSHCSNLVEFSANRNNLHGAIPEKIDNLLKLEVLEFGENHLTGQLPTSIGNLSAFLHLNVGSNGLSGTIPYSLGQLKELNLSYLDENNISGGGAEQRKGGVCSGAGGRVRYVAVEDKWICGEDLWRRSMVKSCCDCLV